MHGIGRMGGVGGRNVSYPLLAQLKHTLVPAVLEQFHASPLQRGDARDLADDVTHKLHLLAELLLNTTQTRTLISISHLVDACADDCPHPIQQVPGYGPLSSHGRCI
jgi:hypothetical protein